MNTLLNAYEFWRYENQNQTTFQEKEIDKVTNTVMDTLPNFGESGRRGTNLPTYSSN